MAVDVAMIADRVCLNNASIGGYAAFVDERERLGANADAPGPVTRTVRGNSSSRTIVVNKQQRLYRRE
ncbi:MAG: hypothetical protein U5K30_01365 [Acidimicrobiales bacterium]|nr:hypothetical protein [Acidimicrobiales bacterium]